MITVIQTNVSVDKSYNVKDNQSRIFNLESREKLMNMIYNKKDRFYPTNYPLNMYGRLIPVSASILDIIESKNFIAITLYKEHDEVNKISRTCLYIM